MGRKDLASAFDLASSWHGRRERAALQAKLAPLWAEENQESALTWIMENLNGAAKNEALLETLQVGRWVQDRPLDALAYAELITHRKGRLRAVDRIFSRWGTKIQHGNSEELDAFVNAVNAMPIDDLLLNHGNLSYDWPNTDLKSAADYLVKVPEDIDLNGFAYYVAQRFGYKKYGPIPELGIEWAGKLTFERGRTAINTILDSNPPNGLGEAIKNLPSGKLKEHAIVAAAKKWSGQPDHVAVGIDWAIESKNKQAIQAARQALNSHALDPDAKAALLKRLE